MSFFTPSDAAYIKGSVRKILASMAAGFTAWGHAERQDEFAKEADAELARLEAFIDGCTLEKGKGSE